MSRRIARSATIALLLVSACSSKDDVQIVGFGSPDTGGDTFTFDGSNADGTVTPDAASDVAIVTDSSGETRIVDADIDANGDGDADAGVATDTPVPDVPPPPPSWAAGVYASSTTTLYGLDPTTSSVRVIGPFLTSAGASVDDILDIALANDGTMYGVSLGHLYRILPEGTKVVCTQIATLTTHFEGLTLVPVGAVDTDKEVLVGITAEGAWTRIELTTGATTTLGSYGAGWSSGGDAVGIRGATYASASRVGENDHLVTIDAKTGTLSKDLGDTGQKQLRGLGFWRGVVYAFSAAGDVYRVDTATGASTLFPSDVKPSGGWSGAAVSTGTPPF